MPGHFGHGDNCSRFFIATNILLSYNIRKGVGKNTQQQWKLNATFLLQLIGNRNAFYSQTYHQTTLLGLWTWLWGKALGISLLWQGLRRPFITLHWLKYKPSVRSTICRTFNKKNCVVMVLQHMFTAPNMEGFKNPVRGSPLDGLSGIDNSRSRRISILWCLPRKRITVGFETHLRTGLCELQ